MKASEVTFLEFLKKPTCFSVPIYQRTYSWTDRECHQLWKDIKSAGENDTVKVHFLGSIVYIEEGLSQVSKKAPSLVIDGQQRLTTLTLLLVALSEFVEDEEPVDGFSKRKIMNYYLINELEKEDRRYKLTLTETDRDTLRSIVDGKEFPRELSVKVKNAYELFRSLIREQEESLEAICRGLEKLFMIDIALNREYDNPQLIFESMNSTGRDLSQADLIRNYILMGQNQTAQSEFYHNYWRPMEKWFGQEAYERQFDKFMSYYLTIKTGKIAKIGEVYDQFKAYDRNCRENNIKAEAVLKNIAKFADHYCRVVLGKEEDEDLKMVFNDIKSLKTEVVYPMILELYDDYSDSKLNRNDFMEILAYTESYIFRRFVCGLPSNSLRTTFAEFCRVIKDGNRLEDGYIEAVRTHYLLMTSYRRFPNNSEFKEDLVKRDMYNIRVKNYWLRKYENHNRKEYVPVERYTVEHIMPQNPDLNRSWRKDLGDNWKEVHETFLHTIGNLTLTGYNSEYSDNSFSRKRDMAGGFKNSPLKLNEGLSKIEKWDREAIESRSRKIADYAAKVWELPFVSEDLKQKHEMIRDRDKEYTLESYENLSREPISEMFNQLRKEILAIDSCVEENCNKHYVSYKAETNFADVQPLTAQLKIILNMSFDEVVDNRGLCRDVSGIGKLGNGDVEVALKSLDDVPYIIGLIKQSYERQFDLIE